MPSRSSRSSPASRTSLSDPTGSASLAMAMTGNLTTGVPDPVVRRNDLPEPGSRFVVAQGSPDPRVEKRAWIQAVRRGRVIDTLEVVVDHLRVVRGDRTADARGHE